AELHCRSDSRWRAALLGRFYDRGANAEGLTPCRLPPVSQRGTSSAPPRHSSHKLLSQRFLVGIDDVAGLLVGRREHRLIAHDAPSIEVRAVGDVVILDLHHSRFGPYAVLSKLYIGGHDRGEGMAAQVFGEPVVVEALGAFDRLLQHLQICVAPPAKVIAE